MLVYINTLKDGPFLPLHFIGKETHRGIKCLLKTTPLIWESPKLEFKDQTNFFTLENIFSHLQVSEINKNMLLVVCGMWLGELMKIQILMLHHSEEFGSCISFPPVSLCIKVTAFVSLCIFVTQRPDCIAGCTVAWV